MQPARFIGWGRFRCSGIGGGAGMQLARVIGLGWFRYPLVGGQGGVLRHLVFGVQPQSLGVGTNEAPVEHPARQRVEGLLFDGTQETYTDARFLRHLFESQLLGLSRGPETVSEI